MKYRSVTLWHRMPDDTYKRILFERVLISKKTGLKVGGSVIDEKNEFEARIFSVAKVGISVGDRITDGYEASTTPPPNAYIIKEIKENFSTSANLRHYRIVCV